MKKGIKIFLLIVVVAIIGYAGFFFLSSKGVIPVNAIPGARTLYEGEVSIEPIPLSELKIKLEEKNIYYTTDEKTITIYPHGVGFGPLSFTITGGTLKAVKDIPGVPDPQKYKEEVRQDIKDIGAIITIKENSWKIIKTTYPWTVVY